MLLFVAVDPVNGQELWRSDGTAAGTILVKDINPGSDSSNPADLTVMGGTVFFSARDPLHGLELWRSDGTAAGTTVIDTIPGVFGSGPSGLVVVDGTLFFKAGDAADGQELWRSDGTDATLVKDINPGSNSSNPSEITALGGVAYFSAFDPVNGVELWRSDGTAAGTALVVDIRPGSASSFPSSLAATAGTLFFAGADLTNGKELWALRAAVPVGNTPTGSNVQVGVGAVSVVFEQVTEAGDTSVTESTTGPPAPANFQLSGVYYDISTTANFIGFVDVCIASSDPAAVLMHYTGIAWTDQTSVPGPPGHVCMRVQSLSPFAVFVPAANTAPAAPGAPVASLNPNWGTFELSWSPSSDAEGDDVVYTVEQRDANDAGFSTVASAVPTASLFFEYAVFAPEGTWAYRVRASDGTLHSAFSPESSPVKVDRSSPAEPTLVPDRSPDYADAGGWYRDTVTVTTVDNGDLALADGSSGSGIDSARTTPPQTIATSGSHEVFGSVFDRVGFERSHRIELNVDAAAPSVSVGCPASGVVLGASAVANWTASDAHSGLATEAAGAIILDTSSIGTKTATSPVARDNVGHEATASCTYQVVYDFAGFFRPVENLPTLNVVNAGRAIPVKFSLGGNHGLDVLAAGYPRSEPIACDSNGTVDGIDETLTAESSSLTYDASSGHYVYVWKTDLAWAGTCRQLVVKLDDGTYHRANFKFK
jgi:ELWxxDGT repeat protein